MLTQEDDVDAHALHRQGWTISAICWWQGTRRTTGCHHDVVDEPGG